MVRLLLLLALLVSALLLPGSTAPDSAGAAELFAILDDCPCDDDESSDACCASATCACFVPTAVAMSPERGGHPGRRGCSFHPARVGWEAPLGAPDRSTVPPTPPPIG